MGCISTIPCCFYITKTNSSKIMLEYKHKRCTIDLCVFILGFSLFCEWVTNNEWIGIGHNLTEILFKVALNTIKQTYSSSTTEYTPCDVILTAVTLESKSGSAKSVLKAYANLNASISLWYVNNSFYTSPWSRFELATSVVIGTDCIGSCKSNYHTITAMMAPAGICLLY
jgi:hypothetical protein